MPTVPPHSPAAPEVDDLNHHCTECGRTLTAEASIARGTGPVCALHQQATASALGGDAA
jgi:hypothetical protein